MGNILLSDQIISKSNINNKKTNLMKNDNPNNIDYVLYNDGNNYSGTGNRLHYKVSEISSESNHVKITKLRCLQLV